MKKQPRYPQIASIVGEINCVDYHLRIIEAGITPKGLYIRVELPKIANSTRSSKKAKLGAITQLGNPASKAGNATQDAINTP